MTTRTSAKRAIVVTLTALMFAVGAFSELAANAQPQPPAETTTVPPTTAPPTTAQETTTSSTEAPQTTASTTVTTQPRRATTTAAPRSQSGGQSQPTTTAPEETTTTTANPLLVPGPGSEPGDPAVSSTDTSLDAQPAASSSDEDNTGTVVALVIAGLLVVALLIGLLTWRYWSYTKPKPVPAGESGPRQKPGRSVAARPGDRVVAAAARPNGPRHAARRYGEVRD